MDCQMTDSLEQTIKILESSLPDFCRFLCKISFSSMISYKKKMQRSQPVRQTKICLITFYFHFLHLAKNLYSLCGVEAAFNSFLLSLSCRGNCLMYSGSALLSILMVRFLEKESLSVPGLYLGLLYR